MTTQEAYEGIRAHFTQRGQEFGTGISSFNFQPVCKYRGDGHATDTRRCAVGCLIPDDLYHPSMEGEGVRALMASHDALSTYFYDVSLEFLVKAQAIHDSIGIVDDNDARDPYSETYSLLRELFICRLDELAKAFRLNVVKR